MPLNTFMRYTPVAEYLPEFEDYIKEARLDRKAVRVYYNAIIKNKAVIDAFKNYVKSSEEIIASEDLIPTEKATAINEAEESTIKNLSSLIKSINESPNKELTEAYKTTSYFNFNIKLLYISLRIAFHEKGLPYKYVDERFIRKLYNKYYLGNSFNYGIGKVRKLYADGVHYDNNVFDHLDKVKSTFNNALMDLKNDYGQDWFKCIMESLFDEFKDLTKEQIESRLKNFASTTLSWYVINAIKETEKFDYFNRFEYFGENLLTKETILKKLELIFYRKHWDVKGLHENFECKDILLANLDHEWISKFVHSTIVNLVKNHHKSETEAVLIYDKKISYGFVL